MKIRYIIFCAAWLACGCVQLAQAQIDRNVEVVKAYVPKIEPTEKLMLTPDMSDDAYIMPDIDYSITPISIETTFDLTHYKMSNLDFSRYESSPRYYLKAGVGLPFQSVVDLYASSFDLNQNFVVGYINHTGRYANIQNDFNVRHSGSSQSHFRGGLIAGTYLGKRDRLLRGELQYRNDLWSRYATGCDRAYAHPLYQSGGVRLDFGDDFASMNGVNFALNGGANYFADRLNYRSFAYDFAGLIGGKLFGGDVVARAGYSFVDASRISVSNSIIDAAVNYTRYGEKFRFVAGVKAYIDDMSNTPGMATYVVPRLMLDYNLSKTALVGYLDVDGELLRNDFASLSDVNPYLAPNSYGERNTVVYSGDLGLKGVVGRGAFSYDVYFDYENTQANRYWTFVGAPYSVNNYFTLTLANLTKMGVNAELEYVPRSNTLLRFEASMAAYDDDSSAGAMLECGLPSVEASLEFSQKFGSFLATLSGDYRSSRRVSVMDISTLAPSVQTLAGEVDLGLSLEYRKSDRLVLFVDGRNLLNSNIYDWVNYREYGVNVMAGVKLQF